MNFVENLSIHYLNFAEQIPGYNFIFIILFAGILGWFIPVNTRMQRGTYFLNSSIILFGSALAQLIWLYILQAIAHGFLFILVTLDIIAWGIVAYALVIISKARSNDAYGHARYAAAGFIPIANLWLLFTPPKDKNYPPMAPILSGGTAVFLGLIIAVGGRGVTASIENAMNTSVRQAITPEMRTKITNRWISFKLENEGLPGAFEYLKSLENIGGKIGEGTILKGVDIADRTLTYQFLITDNAITGFSKEQLNIWQEYVCSSNQEIYTNGGSIIFNYYSASQPVLARIIGNSEVCF